MIKVANDNFKEECIEEYHDLKKIVNKDFNHYRLLTLLEKLIGELECH